MKLYPNLFAYLNDFPAACLHLPVKAKNRPVLIYPTFNPPASLISRDAQAYEIGFPYLLPQDIGRTTAPENRLTKQWDLSNKSKDGSTLNRLWIADEVLDASAIQEDKPFSHDTFSDRVGDRLDDRVALMLKILVGLFHSLGQNFTSAQFEISLAELNQHLDRIDLRDATLPVVVSLNRRYNLHQKLQRITPNLRHQLRRRTEAMRVEQIQEMDAYSMRDFMRRPGRNAAEKAGAKQELTGVNRYADYNTAENKFLLYFAGQVLHGECDRYEKSNAQQYRSEVVRLRHLITRLKQQCSQEKTRVVTDKTYQFKKPNYVLLKDPLYRSFYKAYLDYISHKQEIEQIWPFRNQLLADALYLFLIAAVMQFPESELQSAPIQCRSNPDRGRYLILDNTRATIRTAIHRQMSIVSVQRPDSHQPQCDWMLTVKSMCGSDSGSELNLPIWVFWYVPDKLAIAQAETYMNQFSDYPICLLFYLQKTANKYSRIGDVGYSKTGKVWMFQLPAAIESLGFSVSVDFLRELLQRLLFLSIRS